MSQTVFYSQQLLKNEYAITVEIIFFNFNQCSMRYWMYFYQDVSNINICYNKCTYSLNE